MLPETEIYVRWFGELLDKAKVRVKMKKLTGIAAVELLRLRKWKAKSCK